MNKRLLAPALAISLSCGIAQAADLQLFNADPANVGLNDPTPAAPVGGNTGTTIGAQRQFVYRHALSTWGSVLGSNAPVVVSAKFAPLTCTATSAVLGSAGANWVSPLDYNLPTGTAADPWRPGALVNALYGSEQNPGAPAINSQFNGALGAANCLAGSGWYYGLDGNTPAGKINFLNVVMHEIAHGLGAAGFLNKTTGALFLGGPDVYSAKARDNITGMLFSDPTMTNTQRAIAMRTNGATVWTGANVNQQAALLLDSNYQNALALHVSAPAAMARDYGFYTASFGPAPTPANFNGQWVLATDVVEPAVPPGLPGTTTDGCSPFTNAAAIAGKIAMVDRGYCGFAVKVKNAQLAGATAVVVLNSASTWGAMGGTDPTITIPSVIVQQVDGIAFKANAPITGGMVLGPVTLAGMDTNGRTRLYSPWVVAPGSTFSHFDTVLHPDALMEPFDSPEVQAQLTLDLTPALLRDIGWPMNNGNTKLFNGICDTGVPAAADGGIAIGANIAGADATCKIGATRTTYYSCMNAYASKLYTDGLINGTQKSKILTCARRTSDNWGR
jgi:hypothetical protein